ncbi:putative reverse transcriptase domain-containing protein [Tanacetum coccineum]
MSTKGKGVNGNVKGANGGAPDFSTIIALQLQNLLPVMLAQVSNRGNVRNQNGNVVNENDVRRSWECVSKWKPGVQDMNVVEGKGPKSEIHCCSFVVECFNVVNSLRSACKAGKWVGAANEPKTMQKAMQISGALTDEAVRNGSIKKVEKRGNVGETSKDKNGNRPNQVVDNNGGQGRRNQGNQARGRAFMLGAEEARQDPNIMTGTFTLNDHFATTLFDFGADYNFVSTTFIPLLRLEPNDLGFRYEIEIASGQLVEIDKVIKGCKLEIEGHVFNIDLIHFGHGSFDMIIGMDWLSNYKAEIICHEKVVRIPLLDGKVLRVVGERPKEKARLLMSAKASDKKQEEIVVVRDFPEVFPDDLSGLPPIREIDFILINPLELHR